MSADVVSLILQGLKYVPEFVEVGKDIWKNLKSPAKLAVEGAQNGIKSNTFYSGDYMFQISIPDNNWSFWQPTPEFIASLGVQFAMPVRAIPIMILSKNMVRLYRPMVNIVIEDVGSLTSVQELVAAQINMLQLQGYAVDKDSVKIEPKSNSAALIAKIKSPVYQTTQIYNVLQLFLYAGRSYTLSATYSPLDASSPQLFGGLQDILNSFKLIK
jgi:hypothetical protein